MPAPNVAEPFRDTEQRALVCRVLCELVSLPGMWSAFGPTDRARDFLAKGRAGLTAGQGAYLSIAWDLWDGSRAAPGAPFTMRDVVEIVSGRYLRILGELLIAISEGFDSVDAWIHRHDGGMVPMP